MGGGGSIYLLFVFVFAAFITDLLHKKVPNRLVVTGTVVGFLFTIWSQAPFVIVKRFLGAVLIFGFLYLLYAVGTVGAGDVKLLMMISMYVDLSDYGHILILSLAVAGIMSLAVMIREGRVLERVSGVFAYFQSCFMSKRLLMYDSIQTTEPLTIPLAVAICIGYILWMMGIWR